VKLGYFVPEFPGQTHIFFWRELKALRKLGVDADIVSTRMPDRSIICHAWSEAAMRETTYLFPPTIGGMCRAAVDVLVAGPSRWIDCLRSIASVDDLGLAGKLRLFALVLMGAHLARIARDRGWTHIHAHSCADVALVAAYSKLLFGLPYSLTLHGPLNYFGPGQREKWRHAEFAIVITELLKREVGEQLPFFAQDKIEVAAMGVDLENFTRHTPYVAAKPGETLRLVSCGRLHEGKGHQDVFEAIARLRDRGVDVYHSVLGEGPWRAALEARIAELNLSDRVQLRGAVAEEGVRQALETANIFVLGSHEEGIGVATMEAMSLEMPVVVTGVGGVPELVTDGVHGRLVPTRDPNAMAEAVMEVAGDPDRAVAMGKAGRARIVEKFSSEVSARAIARRLGVEVT
jgi:colanic acid/amylovoran biosynthesis glycosyltransferase